MGAVWICFFSSIISCFLPLSGRPARYRRILSQRAADPILPTSQHFISNVLHNVVHIIAGGHPCSFEIPNGISAKADDWRRDDGTSRKRLNYKCNEGFRTHRTISHIECVAGTWLTWQERFGLNTLSLCIPLGAY